MWERDVHISWDMRLQVAIDSLILVASTTFVGLGLQAQHLRIGVVAGAPVTVDYPVLTSPAYVVPLPDGSTLNVPAFSAQSLPRTLIGGPVLGWQFNDTFSIEGSAIYRRLRIELLGPTVTWQFPVMAKYRFPVAALTPFLEVGPSFRTTGNRNTEPSHFGVSAGGGFDWQWGAMRISPTLRYTRWARDRQFTHPSKQDQVEALVYFTTSPQNDRRPLGGRFSLGLIAGGMLNSPARSFSTPFSFGAGATEGILVNTTTNPIRPFIIGPHFEFLLSEHWGLSGAATYRPMRVNTRTEGLFPGPGGIPREVDIRDRFTMAVLWQFPVLAKYRFSGDRVRPFLEAGPSFRLPQDFNGNLSSFGVTTGAGVDFRWKAFHIEPGLRFSHFGPARTRSGQVEPNYTHRNQLDAVCVFRF